MGGSNLKTLKNGSDILLTINEEMIALYNYLEKHNVSEPEVSRLLEPLIEAVEGENAISKRKDLQPAVLTNSQERTNERNIVKKLLGIDSFTNFHIGFILCIVIAILSYALFKVEIVGKITTIFGRQILMVLLPYWDWPRIYYADCFITNPFYVTQTLTTSDCNICESLETIESLSKVPVSVATDEYLRNDRPFVVTDGTKDWPVMNTDEFWFDNITELYRSQELRNIYPCELTSNLRMRPDDLQAFLRRIHLPSVDRWYGHWENCNKIAAKALRNIYQRPYFMPHMIDFSDTNWVIMSSDYKAKVYKELRFQSEVLWFGALRGWWHIRIVPREPCNDHCPELTVTLMEGHILVVTNLLWRLEYIPGEDTDNLAIAVGGFWN